MQYMQENGLFKKNIKCRFFNELGGEASRIRKIMSAFAHGG
jgi:hypothetical protein